MKVLVFGAHPDDEILGCGGTIVKHIKNGDSVDVCIITIASDPEWDDDYRENKIREQKEIDNLLGIRDRYHFNYITLELNTVDRGRLNQHFTNLIRDIKPDVIYTHYNCSLNHEHNLVSLGTLVGSRIPNKSTIYMYETESARYFLKPFKPNYYVNINCELMEKKLDAFDCYKSEVRNNNHPRSLTGIKNLAMYRGDEMNVDYAEAFIQVRRLWI